MGVAGKIVTLAVSLGMAAGLACRSGAETLRADRLLLDVPDGGMTQAGPAESVSTFKHKSLDLTVTAEVGGYYENWQRSCTPEKLPGEAVAPYQLGTLPRAGPYFYSRITRLSKHGISTPKGDWLEHCLLFRSGDLAAKLAVHHPKSALEKGEITRQAIERLLASAQLTDMSLEDRGTRDPRLLLDLPDDIAPADLPTFTFRYKHKSLPFGLTVSLSDPKSYEMAKQLNRISARVWKTGSLPRNDEHYYYLVWPDPYPDFVLGFRAAGLAARIHVGVTKAALDKGDVTVKDIERFLASARPQEPKAGE